MRLRLPYLYSIIKYGYPHSVDDALKSLPEIRDLGFRFIDPDMVAIDPKRRKPALDRFRLGGSMDCLGGVGAILRRCRRTPKEDQRMALLVAV